MKYRIVTHTSTRTHAADWERKCCIADKPNQNWRKVFVDAQQQQQHSVWPKSSGQCSAPASSRMTDSIRAGHLMRIELCARVHQDLLTSNSEYVNWAQHTCDRKFSLRPRPISMAGGGDGEGHTHTIRIIINPLSETMWLHAIYWCAFSCLSWPLDVSVCTWSIWIVQHASECVFETLAAHPFCTRMRWQDAPSTRSSREKTRSCSPSSFAGVLPAEFWMAKTFRPDWNESGTR